MFNIDEKTHKIDNFKYAYRRGYEEDGIAYIKCKETSLLFTTTYYSDSEKDKYIITYKYCPYCGKYLFKEADNK